MQDDLVMTSAYVRPPIQDVGVEDMGDIRSGKGVPDMHLAFILA